MGVAMPERRRVAEKAVSESITEARVPEEGQVVEIAQAYEAAGVVEVGIVDHKGRLLVGTGRSRRLCQQRWL